jgi:hypothetical protein
MPLHIDHTLTIDQLPPECIDDCSRPGPADEAVAYWLRELGFTVDRARAINCLENYGAWEREELEASDDDTLASRVLWLACGDFNEWDGTDSSPAGSDIFCLE